MISAEKLERAQAEVSDEEVKGVHGPATIRRPSALNEMAAGVRDQEALRHSRIDEIIESTELRAFYDLRTEHDLSGDPQEISIASPESLLATLTSRRR